MGDTTTKISRIPDRQHRVPTGTEDIDQSTKPEKYKEHWKIFPQFKIASQTNESVFVGKPQSDMSNQI